MTIKCRKCFGGGIDNDISLVENNKLVHPLESAGNVLGEGSTMTFSLVENNKLVHPLVHTEEDFVCVCVWGGEGTTGGTRTFSLVPESIIIAFHNNNA